MGHHAFQSTPQRFFPSRARPHRPGSNTIEVVEGVRERLPDFLKRLPVKEGYTDPYTGQPASGLNLDVAADQSVFVRTAISSLAWEGVLASLMVLVFIGSFRSTIIIALTIPLSALAAVIGLYFTGNTLNAMTLGGLASSWDGSSTTRSPISKIRFAIWTWASRLAYRRRQQIRQLWRFRFFAFLAFLTKSGMCRTVTSRYQCKNFPGVFWLAFSPDGSLLAAAMGEC